MITTAMKTPVPTGDVELVHASLSGDKDAFAQIVARYQKLVCSMAYSATGSLSQSEDLAQDTFVAAWRNLGELREPAKLRQWLCGIARNLISTFQFSQSREPSHRAEPLDAVAPSDPAAPLPPECLINDEEAAIMWRSLQHLPETYRLPLILFYREHQSVDAVARQLELSEETVRQRLSRGRKLLQNEVLSFVECALEKTAPGKSFTLAVIAALPLGVASVQAATIGAVAAKGTLGGKGALSFAALSGWLGILGALFFSWKTAADTLSSPRQRRLMMRVGWFQIALLVLCVSSLALILPLLPRHSIAAGSALALLLLAILINSVILPQRLTRRLTSIALEEGVETSPAMPGQHTDREAFRKVLRWMMPILFMFLVGLPYLPWKEHWARCALVTGVELAVFIWGFRRYRRTLVVGPEQPASSIQRFLHHPLVLMPAIVLGSGAIGAFLPIFLNPARTKPAFDYPLIGTLGLTVLLAVVGYALFALIARRMMPAGWGVSGKLGSVWNAFSSDPRLVAQKGYGAFCEQVNLTPDQCDRLVGLIVKRVTAQTTATIPFLSRRLDSARRAELIERLKRAPEDAEAEIRELLGPEIYLRFEKYETTLLDRTRLIQFSANCLKGGCPLRPEQEEQLLQALLQARSNYPWTTTLGRRDHFATDLSVLNNPSSIEIFAREEQDFDLQFVSLAQALLSSEQLAAYMKFQDSQRRLQLSQIKMSAKLLGLRSRNHKRRSLRQMTAVA